ncbi:outer membrane beta-barrel protein [Negadavirga shengliensis]|uniref:Outer membrane beta-barrel protein n=1 Tax=Negadavirga shengliensis TaxID=1389218 RepID=A0ABV9T5L9_9BACT
MKNYTQTNPKLLILLFYLLCGGAAHSQSHPELILSNQSIRLGIFYVQDQPRGSDRIYIQEGIGYHRDFNQFNFTTGISMEYFVKERFSLNSGLAYSNRDFTIEPFCYLCTSLPQALLIDTFRIPYETVKLRSLEIPLTGRYYFTRSKFSLFGEGGLVNQIVLEKQHTIWADTWPIIARNYALSGRVAAGTEYKAGKNLGIQFSAEYTRYITNLYTSADYDYSVLGFSWGVVKAF